MFLEIRAAAAVALVTMVAPRARLAAGASPAAAEGPGLALDELGADDECLAEDAQHCAFSAAQLRAARRVVSEVRADVGLVERGETRGLLDALAPSERYNASASGGLEAPSMATQYDGVEDRRLIAVEDGGSGEAHAFAIGDWGAPIPSHRTFPHTRGRGQCPEDCGYVWGIDDGAQLHVARAMSERAARVRPQYVLNVGDNFYPAGNAEPCWTGKATGMTMWSFQNVWKDVYGGLTRIPWLSTLGNHDYGGYQFNKGWPQEIGYSFVNHNWIMPARYYSRTVHHPGFTVQYFMLDSNAYDAKHPREDGEHNICGLAHNPGGASCRDAGGPHHPHHCYSWFWDSYLRQKAWLKERLRSSAADWQVVVTHFPCGYDRPFYSEMHRRYGLDLLATGHRHDQELWARSRELGGLTCFVTGGGGGITSEGSPRGRSSSQYGFFDLTISKERMKIENVAISGRVTKSTSITPVGVRGVRRRHPR